MFEDDFLVQSPRRIPRETDGRERSLMKICTKDIKKTRYSQKHTTVAMQINDVQNESKFDFNLSSVVQYYGKMERHQVLSNQNNIRMIILLFMSDLNII